ncbi:DUF3306 domain-containing protein [Vibrio harveyi]|uniref:DUF3306 domain-containing protein n=1 Tax=Vibrio harveyi TaxID=669 RepID=UPI00373667A5
MATSFFSRWSKRKLEETTTEPTDAKVVDSVESTEPETAQAHEELSTEAQALATEASVTETESQQTSSETTDPEEMSVAQLLVSEAPESVKKAALRKMFLSEEFNVRDGLDDYDDDYSNLKSLSEGVAETLRDWVKEKTEEEPAEETTQSTESYEESDIELADVEPAEGAEIPEEQKELDINTVSNKSDNLETKLAPEEVGQNIPHKE